MLDTLVGVMRADDVRDVEVDLARVRLTVTDDIHLTVLIAVALDSDPAVRG